MTNSAILAGKHDDLEALLSTLRLYRQQLAATGYLDDVEALAGFLTELEETLSHVLNRPEPEVEFDLLRRTAILLARAVSEEEILNAMLDGLRPALPYDAAGVYLVEPELPIHRIQNETVQEVLGEHSELSALVFRGYDVEEHRKFRQKFNEGIVGWCIANAQSIVVDDVRQDERYVELNSSTLSEMAVPIISRDVVIGAINLEADQVGAFPKENLRLLENIGHYAAVALERAKTHRQLMEAKAVERELEIAREIQNRLLPEKQPTVQNYDIAGYNVPSEAVGGDYYDYIEITDKDLGLVIADVAGKGFAAGLVMASLRSALRTRVETTYSIRHVVTNVNRFLYDSTGPERYVTGFYGVLDTPSGLLTYVNAGHNPPLLIHADGRVVRLTAGGPLLGVLRDAEYSEATATIEPGATLVMYTDGIIEAGGDTKEEFGEDRVLDIVRRHSDASARKISHTIEREAVRYHGTGGSPIDDRTVIVVKHL